MRLFFMNNADYIFSEIRQNKPKIRNYIYDYP